MRKPSTKIGSMNEDLAVSVWEQGAITFFLVGIRFQVMNGLARRRRVIYQATFVEVPLMPPPELGGQGIMLLDLVLDCLARCAEDGAADIVPAGQLGQIKLMVGGLDPEFGCHPWQTR
jgi:hypothetical protein